MIRLDLKREPYWLDLALGGAHPRPAVHHRTGDGGAGEHDKGVACPRPPGRSARG